MGVRIHICFMVAFVYDFKWLNSTQRQQQSSTTTQVASKDEQAELIRKQKAKLERHFRRSTQVTPNLEFKYTNNTNT